MAQKKRSERLSADEALTQAHSVYQFINGRSIPDFINNAVTVAIEDAGRLKGKPTPDYLESDEVVINMLAALFRETKMLHYRELKSGLGFSKKTRDEQDADLLFDVMNSGAGGNAGEPVYEVGCVLDEAMNAGGTIYDHKDIFRQLYIAEDVGQHDDVKAILRALRRGQSITEIARQFYRQGFNGARLWLWGLFDKYVSITNEVRKIEDPQEADRLERVVTGALRNAVKDSGGQITEAGIESAARQVVIRLTKR
jgi:hypothetical protein